MRKILLAVVVSVFLLSSCSDNHDEYRGDVIIPASDGSYWIEEIDVDNPEEVIVSDDTEPGMMYGAFSDDALNARSAGPDMEMNPETGSFSLHPDDDGQIRFKPSDLGLSHGDKLLWYQLRKHELTYKGQRSLLRLYKRASFLCL